MHVSAQPLQAAILGPNIRVVGGHQTLHCCLQVAQKFPMLLPTQAEGTRASELPSHAANKV